MLGKEHPDTLREPKQSGCAVSMTRAAMQKPRRSTSARSKPRARTRPRASRDASKPEQSGVAVSNHEGRYAEAEPLYKRAFEV